MICLRINTYEKFCPTLRLKHVINKGFPNETCHWVVRAFVRMFTNNRLWSINLYVLQIKKQFKLWVKIIFKWLIIIQNHAVVKTTILCYFLNTIKTRHWSSRWHGNHLKGPRFNLHYDLEIKFNTIAQSSSNKHSMDDIPSPDSTNKGRKTSTQKQWYPITGQYKGRKTSTCTQKQLPCTSDPLPPTTPSINHCQCYPAGGYFLVIDLRQIVYS